MLRRGGCAVGNLLPPSLVTPRLWRIFIGRAARKISLRELHSKVWKTTQNITSEEDGTFDSMLHMEWSGLWNRRRICSHPSCPHQSGDGNLLNGRVCYQDDQQQKESLRRRGEPMRSHIPKRSSVETEPDETLRSYRRRQVALGLVQP